MDEEKKELDVSAEPEFSLEDILKEFGDDKPEQPAEAEEDVQIWDGNVPAEPKQSTAFPSDTVRIGDVT